DAARGAARERAQGSRAPGDAHAGDRARFAAAVDGGDGARARAFGRRGTVGGAAAAVDRSGAALECALRGGGERAGGARRSRGAVLRFASARADGGAGAGGGDVDARATRARAEADAADDNGDDDGAGRGRPGPGARRAFAGADGSVDAILEQGDYRRE